MVIILIYLGESLTRDHLSISLPMTVTLTHSLGKNVPSAKPSGRSQMRIQTCTFGSEKGNLSEFL
jgi:hypothetical protein